LEGVVSVATERRGCALLDTTTIGALNLGQTLAAELWQACFDSEKRI
jgi:hypothetical protein